MNKISLADIYNKYMITKYAFGEIGATGNTTYATISANINTLTNKADIHIQAKIISNTKDSTNFSWISLTKIASLLYGYHNMEYASMFDTRVIPVYWPDINTNKQNVYTGYTGLYLDYERDSHIANISRIYTTTESVGGWPLNVSLYEPDTVYSIDIFGATLT